MDSFQGSLLAKGTGCLLCWCSWLVSLVLSLVICLVLALPIVLVLGLTFLCYLARLLVLCLWLVCLGCPWRAEICTCRRICTFLYP